MPRRPHITASSGCCSSQAESTRVCFLVSLTLKYKGLAKYFSSPTLLLHVNTLADQGSNLTCPIREHLKLPFMLLLAGQSFYFSNISRTQLLKDDLCPLTAVPGAIGSPRLLSLLRGALRCATNAPSPVQNLCPVQCCCWPNVTHGAAGLAGIWAPRMEL